MNISEQLTKIYFQLRNLSDMRKFRSVNKYFEKLNGCEIGGPTAMFAPIYSIINNCDCVNFSSDTVWAGNLSRDYIVFNKRIGKQMIMDGTMLDSINDNTYNFMLSSNNLEHIANPMKAISEWKRVLTVRWHMMILVPQKDFMFDHNRDITPYAHLLKDYNRNTPESDLTHLSEILDKHDLSMDKPAGTFDEFKNRSLNNINNRCLHHHVFDLTTLEQMMKFFGMEVIDKFSAYHNWIIISKKI